MRKLVGNIVNIKPSKLLIWSFAFAIFFILLYDFWLLEIPEKINGGHKLGSILYKVCFAFVTSYIFYFVNIQLKKKDDKKNISPYLAKKTHLIIQRTKNLFSEIGTVSGKKFQIPYPDETDLNGACKLISPNSNARMVKEVHGENPYLVPLNWIEYFFNYYQEVNEAIQKIFILMPHLEPKHIKILNEIDESIFFKRIVNDAYAISHAPLKNADLTAWANNLYKLGLLVKSLEEYYDEKLKGFSPGYTKSSS